MRELYQYVWRSSASQQIVLIILAIMAAVMATAPLELQRHIINTLAGHERAERLAWLCGGYLIAALGIGGLKYAVNIKSAGLGESMIRSLREKIFSGTSPPRPHETLGGTAKEQSRTVVTMISAEAEAVGKFVGDCISTPIVQAGTLLSVLSLNPAVSFGSPAEFCGSSQPWREFRPEQGAAAGRVDGPSDSA